MIKGHCVLKHTGLVYFIYNTIVDIYTFIILLHIVGTILGVGGATIAEVSIHRALKDGKVSTDEKALLHGTYAVLRVGMAFIILSAILMVWYHTANNTIGRLLNEKIWFKEFLFLIIIINAVAISNRWVPLWLGAATSFTGWWMATILGVAGRLPYSFFTYLFAFIVATLLVAAALHIIRKKLAAN